MKKLNVLLSLLLIAFVFTVGSLTASVAVAQDKKAAKSKTKIGKKSLRKRYAKNKFRAKIDKKNPARGFQTPRTEEEFEENAEKREEWFIAKRTYPYAEIPADARRRAWLARPGDVRSLSENGRATAVQWQSIGPKPTTSYFPGNWGLTSGRINAIAVSPANPQIVLIGAATGGVWRSTDGGANFAPTADNQVDLAVGSIAFAPSNPAIVYAGMGDKAQGYLGTGVLKSSDGGQNWVRVNNATLPAQGRIPAILVDQNDPNRVYVAQYASRSGNSTFSSGFWYSTDGGVNWTRSLIGLARDLVRHPTQPNTYYLAMQRVDDGGLATGGVFKSTNAGVSWTRVYTSPFATISNIKIAVTPAAPQNVYVATGATPRLEVSTDEGATWTNRGAAFDAGQISYNFYLFVHPTDPNTIYVGTRDLWRTLDGGATFTNITGNFTLTGGYTPTSSKAHPDQHHFYISPTNPSLIYIANDGGLWRSTDGAASFQTLNSTLGLTMFTSLDLHPTDPLKTYGGTQDNGTQRRNSAAVGWREFATGDGGQVVVDPVDPTIVYVTYVYNTVFRYTNSGDTFNATIGSDSVFANDRVAFYPPFVSNGVNSNLYFGTYRLYISANRGASWTAPGGTQDLTNGGGDVLSTIGVSRSNPNVIYTGSATGRAMVSVNGGTTWTNINNGLPSRFIETIIVSPTDPNTAYLTVSGYDSGHVFKTTNGGTNWTDISGNLPNIPTNTFLIDPRNPTTIYVGTDIGVFRSATDGTNWETFNIGLPPTIITELDAQPSGLMQAGSYGRGAFEINLSSNLKTPYDFDGDGKSDVSVFRPENGAWYLNLSGSGFSGTSFGQNGDKIVPADYDGDGKTDIAVFRAGVWYLQRSSLGFTGAAFGAPDDIPVPADYDGDGKADLAVFRPSSGTWYVQQSQNGFIGVAFGQSGDVPTASDFDGDAKADIAVFRGGIWYIQRSSLGFTGIAFGEATDKPVPADYDADGKSDVAVFRPSTGTWYLNRSQLGFTGIAFGQTGDLPVAADYDGDGKTDVAVFRSGTWYLQRTSAGFTGITFGAATDKPIPNAYIP